MRTAARIGIAAADASGAATTPRSRRRNPSGSAYGELNQLVHELAKYRELDKILAAIERAFLNATGLPTALVLPAGGGQVSLRHSSSSFQADEDELQAAAAAIASGNVAQRSRPDGTASCFLPLATWRGVLGAFGFQSRDRIPARKLALIQAFANQTALALLRDSLEIQARQANTVSEAGQFQKILLNSIAHNVRTPLASIIGVLSTLQEDQAVLNRAIRGELIDTARQEAERLNRLLGNLLDLSRIESGVVQVRADPCDVQDVVGAALEQLGHTIRNRKVHVAIDPSLPPVRMDFVLIVQVLVNVLDNALKYSSDSASVSLDARVVENNLRISISDEGDGIPEPDLTRIFEKFHRAGRSGETGGIGLGLSICKGFVEAHHGRIWAECRNPRGTCITLTLPHRAPERNKTPREDADHDTGQGRTGTGGR